MEDLSGGWKSHREQRLFVMYMSPRKEIVVVTTAKPKALKMGGSIDLAYGVYMTVSFRKGLTFIHIYFGRGPF